MHSFYTDQNCWCLIVSMRHMLTFSLQKMEGSHPCVRHENSMEIVVRSSYPFSTILLSCSYSNKPNEKHALYINVIVNIMSND